MSSVNENAGVGKEGKKERAALERYYQFHSRIYDSTRWSFLFGRTAILDRVDAAGTAPDRILEVGCGTGKNMVNLLRQFPNAHVSGVDLSATMLEMAGPKLVPFGARAQLLHRAYDAPLRPPGGYDLILFSYALTMFNPGFQTAIEAAHADLAPGGLIAVVDFHDTRNAWFERWMGVNHVRMNGQLQPLLRSLFEIRTDETIQAYGGVWRYMMFVGRKR